MESKLNLIIFAQKHSALDYTLMNLFTMASERLAQLRVQPTPTHRNVVVGVVFVWVANQLSLPKYTRRAAAASAYVNQTAK